MGVHRGGDDRCALRALVEAYAFMLDRRNGEGFAALFTADATLSIYDADGAETGGYVGRSELIALPERLRRYDQTLHLVHNHDVVIGGDEARGEVYCTAHHVTGRGSDALDRVLTIRYLDGYARQSDRWQFRTRDVCMQWAEEKAVQR